MSTRKLGWGKDVGGKDVDLDLDALIPDGLKPRHEDDVPDEREPVKKKRRRTRKKPTKNSKKNGCESGCTNDSKVKRRWDRRGGEWRKLCDPCASGTWAGQARYNESGPEPDEPEDDLDLDGILDDDDDDDDDGGDAHPGQAVDENLTVVAEKQGFTLQSECPVCRSLEECECEEEDRSFVRRVRFEKDTKKVSRCPRCEAPLSVLYLPRPGTRPPWSLSKFCALHGCLACHPESLATAALSTRRARPHA